MKTLLTLSCALLSVVGMLCVEIKETGTEGNIAVIQCPYTKGFETYPKYFCKGVYQSCEPLIKSDGKEPWVFKRRMSLYDNIEKRMFVVTINALSIKDTGKYGCGIDIFGRDPFTAVQLTVSKVRQHPKPKPSPTSPSTPYLRTTEDPPLPTVSNGKGSTREAKGNSTQPSEVFTYVRGVFGAVVLVLAITSGIFFALRFRTRKAGADTSLPNSQEKMEDIHLYDDIQQSDPTHTNVSFSTNQGCVPNYGNMLAANQNYDPHPACNSIYVTATNEKQEPHPGNTPATTHVPLTDIDASSRVRLVSSPENQSPDGSREPNYCQASFPKDKAWNASVANEEFLSAVQKPFQSQSPVYSLLVASQQPANVISDHTTAISGYHKTHRREC